MIKKYQIFVSSTFRDLVDERQDTIRHILDLSHIPAGMELFPAADIDQFVYIKKIIDECDYYILIVGGRYGSIDADGISFTEKEYDYAVETGKVVLAFVHREPAAIPLGKSDIDVAMSRSLGAFKEKVMSGRLVQMWSSREELGMVVVKALVRAFNDAPQVGWIRASAASTEEALQQANSALRENAELKSRIASMSTAIQIKLDDIAGLDDKTKIRCEAHYGRVSFNKEFFLSWREIVVGMGAVLDKPRISNWSVEQAIRFALIRRGENVSRVQLNDVDRRRVAVQLEALGMINVEVLRVTSGGIEEFLKLTPKGKSIFMSDIIERQG